MVAVLWLIGLLAYYLHRSNFAVLNSKGMVAHQERDLMVFTVALGLLVVLPVLVMTFFIAWKYREGNHKAKYSPEWDHNVLYETLWWGIPTLIIVVLSVITWNSSHALDPHNPLKTAAKPLNVQVVALDWKWLFIYPDQGIATVNYVQFPEKTPVNFQITADAPMNSFWIPQLGGQIYAMAGMSTRLSLMADSTGEYTGSSANLSGGGFAGMQFTAKSTSKADFKTWIEYVKQRPVGLGMQEYRLLAKPTRDNPPAYYSSAEAGLYDKVIMKYMTPGGGQ